MAMVMVVLRWGLRLAGDGWRSCQSGALFFLLCGVALSTLRIDILFITNKQSKMPCPAPVVIKLGVAAPGFLYDDNKVSSHVSKLSR